MTMPLTNGVHHVGLAVPDIEAARDFFVVGLGWEEVGRVPDYPAVFVSDGSALLTLWRVADPETAIRFDRRANVGLHHLALAVADDAGLAAVREAVGAYPGTNIEFEPCPIREGSNARHFICAIPGAIRVEFATRG
jgi:catechol 2,3-dioxygenase-like lactoylglutathione lyase family enzyme